MKKIVYSVLMISCFSYTMEEKDLTPQKIVQKMLDNRYRVRWPDAQTCLEVIQVENGHKALAAVAAQKYLWHPFNMCYRRQLIETLHYLACKKNEKDQINGARVAAIFLKAAQDNGNQMANEYFYDQNRRMKCPLLVTANKNNNKPFREVLIQFDADTNNIIHKDNQDEEYTCDR